VNHQTSLHTYISPQSFQPTKETKKTLKQTKEYPVQQNKVLLQQWKQISPLAFNSAFHAYLCCPWPPSPNSVLKQKKKKKKAANTREFRKRSEQKASKNQTPSLLS
jgi:hypothetical protein